MPLKLHRGQEIDLEVDSLAFGGRGVARHGELVVFVSRALPGDRVRARVTKLKRRHASLTSNPMYALALEYTKLPSILRRTEAPMSQQGRVRKLV